MSMWLVCLISAWLSLAYVFQLLSMQTRLIVSVIKKVQFQALSPNQHHGHCSLDCGCTDLHSLVESLDHRGIVVQCAVMQGGAGLLDAWKCNTAILVACIVLFPESLSRI